MPTTRSATAPCRGPSRRHPEPGSKYTYFDTITEAGTDVIQVAVRASTHIDWTRSVGGIEIPQMSDVLLTHSIYGEMVATYYTLAWFDRYLADDEAEADDALQRLTASGTVAFDDSADLHSIGAGFFDPEAAGTGDDEAGNVPIEIAGIPVRNLLSFHYPSRYVLDGGELACDDLRAGCADRLADDWASEVDRTIHMPGRCDDSGRVVHQLRGTAGDRQPQGQLRPALRCAPGPPE